MYFYLIQLAEAYKLATSSIIVVSSTRDLNFISAETSEFTVGTISTTTLCIFTGPVPPLFTLTRLGHFSSSQRMVSTSSKSSISTKSSTHSTTYVLTTPQVIQMTCRSPAMSGDNERMKEREITRGRRCQNHYRTMGASCGLHVRLLRPSWTWTESMEVHNMP